MKKRFTKFSIIFPVVLVLLLLTSIVIPCASAQGLTLVLNPPECWGVFIGVPDLQYWPWPWTNADADATDFGAALSPTWGTDHVRVLTESQATRSGILSAIDWLATNADTNDTVLFFYSGKTYLNAIYGFDYYTSGDEITGPQLNNAFDSVQTSKKVFIFSFWENNALRTSMSGSGRIVMFASDSTGNVHWNASSRNIFVSDLVKAFNNFDDADANHDYELSAEEMFNYAALLTTLLHYDQVPVMNDQYSGDLPLMDKLVFSTNIALPSSSTIVTIGGSDYDSVPAPFYYIPGRFHIVVVPAIVNGTTGIRYSFTNWNGGDTALATSVTHGALIANFSKEFHLTINSAYDTPLGDGWYVDGTTASFSVTAYLETANTKRTFTGWSGDFTGTAAAGTLIMKAPKTIATNWHSQYLLTINSDYGTPTGPGWYDEGTAANIAVEPTQGIIIRHVFDSWTGDLTSTIASTSVTMNAPKVITANWHADYMQLYIVIGAVIVILLIIIVVVVLTRKKGGTPRVPPTTTYTPPTYSPPPPAAGPPSPPPPAPR